MKHDIKTVKKLLRLAFEAAVDAAKKGTKDMDALRKHYVMSNFVLETICHVLMEYEDNDSTEKLANTVAESVLRICEGFEDYDEMIANAKASGKSIADYLMDSINDQPMKVKELNSDNLAALANFLDIDKNEMLDKYGDACVMAIDGKIAFVEGE